MLRSLLLLVTLQTFARCIAGAPANPPKSGLTDPVHDGFFTWTCSCSNAATKQAHELPGYCNQIRGEVMSNHCVYKANDDRKGPTGFTDEACEDEYGKGFRGTCTRQGGDANSICAKSYGCPVIDTPQSECKAPNDVYTPCTYVTCSKGLLTCNEGSLGICAWGRCQCGTDGRWNLTERLGGWSCFSGIIPLETSPIENAM